MTDVFVTVTVGRKLVLLLPPGGAAKLDLAPRELEALTMPYGQSDLVPVPDESWAFLNNRRPGETAAAATAAEPDLEQVASRFSVAKGDLDRVEQGWNGSIFRNATTQHWVLEAGQTVFIPRGWVHFIANLDPSLSISTQAVK